MGMSAGIWPAPGNVKTSEQVPDPDTPSLAVASRIADSYPVEPAPFFPGWRPSGKLRRRGPMFTRSRRSRFDRVF